MIEGISIYLPTRNRVQLLRQAVASVLAQSDCPPYELIVIDDASTDETANFLNQICTLPNVRVLRLSKHSGANSARNLGILEAKYSHVTGLDDDDIFLPGRLERLATFARRRGSAMCASADYILTRWNLKYSRKAKEIVLRDMRYGNRIGNQVLARKEAFLEAGLFDDDLQAGQDYDMWIRLLAICKKCDIDQRPGQVIFANHRQVRITDNRKKNASYSCVRLKNYEALGMSTAQLNWAARSEALIVDESISLRRTVELIISPAVTVNEKIPLLVALLKKEIKSTLEKSQEFY